MRIWSLHPSLLDAKGLVACWRETLLAQKVLRGLTRGYTQHPQLDRFKAQPDPLAAITNYLHGLADEADRRGYRFDRSRITLEKRENLPTLPVTRGQLDYEFRFLAEKVGGRDRAWYRDRISQQDTPIAHPSFHIVPGAVKPWERTKDLPAEK